MWIRKPHWLWSEHSNSFLLYWPKIQTPYVILLPPCYYVIILFQPHHSSLLQTHQACSMLRAFEHFCSFKQECHLLDFLTFLSSNRTFSERPSLIYLFKTIPTSGTPFSVILCQATLLCYQHVVWHFLKLSCLSVTSLLSLFLHLNTALVRKEPALSSSPLDLLPLESICCTK